MSARVAMKWFYFCHDNFHSFWVFPNEQPPASTLGRPGLKTLNFGVLQIGENSDSNYPIFGYPDNLDLVKHKGSLASYNSGMDKIRFSWNSG